jgi:hypothetical protein
MGLKALTILLLCYFIGGTMFLPEGDFSTLPDLPKMYADCKNLEDPDMGLSDFITEHLFGVDGLFGQDIPEPNEKPHQPVQFHHQFVQISFASRQLRIELQQPVIVVRKMISPKNEECLTGYTVSVFRPPIA